MTQLKTWADACTPRVLEEARQNFLDALSAEGIDVSGFTEGSPQRSIIDGHARALTGESLLRVGLALTASPLTCIAAGPSWVDAAMAWYDLDDNIGGKGRFKATRAQWVVPLIGTAAGGPYTIDNTSTMQAQADDGTIYACSQPSAIVLNAGNSYKGIPLFAARIAGTGTGKGGPVNPGHITKLLNAPAGLSVDQAQLAAQFRSVAPRDPEADAAFVQRGIASVAARRGAGWTKAAIEYLALLAGNNGSTLSVSGVSVNDANPDGPGTVRVSLSDDDAPSTAPEVAAVQAFLTSIDIKPAGSGLLTAQASTAHPLTITAVQTTDGSNSAAAANASSALQIFGKKCPQGPATIEPDLIRAILMGTAIATATIKTGATFTEIALDLPGFLSVEKIASLSLVAPEVLVTGEKLVLTLAVS